MVVQTNSSMQETMLDPTALTSARRGAVYGWISTLLWVLLGIDSIVRPIQDDRREIFWWFPYVFMMLTIMAVHRVQRRAERRLENITFWVVMIAWVLVLIRNLGLVFHVPTLLPLRFPKKAIVAAVGLIVYGVATGRARVLPWYAGLGLILWEPGSIATGLLLAPISPLRDRGSYSAGLWKGFAIGIVAMGLYTITRSRFLQQADRRSA